jgi:hypothetical protein
VPSSSFRENVIPVPRTRGYISILIILKSLLNNVPYSSSSIHQSVNLCDCDPNITYRTISCDGWDCHALASATHGHPLFGSQVEHEAPGPLSRCQYRCRINLTTDSPAVASPDSSPTEGRAAPSTMQNAMASEVPQRSHDLNSQDSILTSLSSELAAMTYVLYKMCARCRLGYARHWL